MYSNRPNLYIGFHGCDESVRNQLVNNPNTMPKEQEYDLLRVKFDLTDLRSIYSKIVEFPKGDHSENVPDQNELVLNTWKNLTLTLPDGEKGISSISNIYKYTLTSISKILFLVFVSGSIVSISTAIVISLI